MFEAAPTPLRNDLVKTSLRSLDHPIHCHSQALFRRVLASFGAPTSCPSTRKTFASPGLSRARRLQCAISDGACVPPLGLCINGRIKPGTAQRDYKRAGEGV